MHHEQLAGADFVGSACLAGYYVVLYEDLYPALVPGEGSAQPEHVSVVNGELYRVTQSQLDALDRFEECPHLYQRSPVQLLGGTLAQAYVITAEKAKTYSRLSIDYREYVSQK